MLSLSTMRYYFFNSEKKVKKKKTTVRLFSVGGYEPGLRELIALRATTNLLRENTTERRNASGCFSPVPIPLKVRRLLSSAIYQIL